MKQAKEMTAPVAAAEQEAPTEIWSPKHRDINNFDDIVDLIEECRGMLDWLPDQDSMDFMIDLAHKVLEENGLQILNTVRDFIDLRFEETSGVYPLERFVYDYLRIWSSPSELLSVRGEDPEVRDALRVFFDPSESQILQEMEVCPGFDLTRFMTQWFLSHKSDPVTLRLARLYAHFIHRDYSDLDYDEIYGEDPEIAEVE